MRALADSGDLWRVLPEDAARHLMTQLRDAWHATVARGRPSLTRAFVSAFGLRYTAWSTVAAVRVAAVLAQTQLLALLLDELSAPSDSGRTGELQSDEWCACDGERSSPS